MKWAAAAFSVKDQQPVDGVEFTFELTDTRSGLKTLRNCVTPADGVCSLTVPASSSFFAGKANMNAVVTYKKAGFQDTAHISWKDTDKGKTAFFMLTPVGYAEEQSQAALMREQEQARASAAAQLARAERSRRIASAHEAAAVVCKNKAQCDKVFALAEIYVSEHSATKIQTATATTITTYNPTSAERASLNARRLPGKGDSSTVSLQALCKDELLYPSDACVDGAIATLNGFAGYVQSMLKN
ncbi:hypothetical protein PO883_21495 [Massilia sp. DJPM01]|uniref:hypothetical protein n=1 Tax=Massilia sp. DJPM01 TaxID=3024404 RepID=UPI00259D3249|nr:hypothetical protein [Massilia sp. DJPM01]MDM5179770.1 hypothetical protein [Massilia sp. DJPM01]